MIWHLSVTDFPCPCQHFGKAHETVCWTLKSTQIMMTLLVVNYPISQMDVDKMKCTNLWPQPKNESNLRLHIMLGETKGNKSQMFIAS